MECVSVQLQLLVFLSIYAGKLLVLRNENENENENVGIANSLLWISLILTGAVSQISVPFGGKHVNIW
jgi:hypothetical protein